MKRLVYSRILSENAIKHFEILKFERLILKIYLINFQDMKQILDNYNLMLDNLIGIYDSNKEWIHVKMIDFAHTYRIDELPEPQKDLTDRNYLEAVENLIGIFEDFLKECDV